VLLLLLNRSLFASAGVVLIHESLEELMRLQVDIPDDLKTRLKLQSVREGVTMSEVVEKALLAYLDQIEKPASAKTK
jgi:metal-responsive CopG/Arc/MetJ family transcriptional regulator